MSSDGLMGKLTHAFRVQMTARDIRAAIARGNARELELHLNMLDRDSESICACLQPIIDDDRESGAANRRWLLKGRIRRMVEKLEKAKGMKAYEIHTQWLELGGSPQDAMSVYDLERKVDWFYNTWPDVFKRDTRDWKPPVNITGNEPALPAKSRVGEV